MTPALPLQVRWLLALVLLFGVPTAGAQSRAWLDRDRIALGESVTLNIETSANAAPDYAPLLSEFSLGGQASRQYFELANGQARSRTVYSVTLRPRRTGLLPIPTLRVGAQRTAPATLLVTDALPAPAGGKRDVFIESEADDQDPYVQQSVGWVVRLYSALPLISGSLDQEAPAGASLRQVGEAQYDRTIGNRTYQVIERRYLLIPERSGELVVPPARFRGRAVGNALDRYFGDGQRTVEAQASPRVVGVRPIPPTAPEPWLPLHSLALEYGVRPQRLRAGSASTVEIELTADGAAGAQLPEIRFPDVPGVQVYADRPQFDDTLVEGRPRVRLTQRFSIVPTRAGRFSLPGPAIQWWDVNAGQARTTRLPPLELDVAPGAQAPGGAASDGAGPTGVPLEQAPTGRSWPTVFGVLLGLLGIALLVRRRMGRRDPVPASGEQTVAAEPEPVPLARVLDLGDLGDIEAALRSMAPGQVRDLDGLLAALANPDQQAAVTALRQARWGDGDPREARSALRAAFANGPVWRTAPGPVRESLPPLYPRR